MIFNFAKLRLFPEFTNVLGQNIKELPICSLLVCPNIIFLRKTYLGSAELISSHRQRVADVGPHSDDNDEKPPDFGQDKKKVPQELHHVFDEVAHSRPASCCLWKLGSYVIGSIDSLASTE